jgi:hypothetical protein
VFLSAAVALLADIRTASQTNDLARVRRDLVRLRRLTDSFLPLLPEPDGGRRLSASSGVERHLHAVESTVTG